MKKLFIIEDYFTGDIIDVSSNFDDAVKICTAHDGAIITTEDSDEVLYDNSIPV